MRQFENGAVTGALETTSERTARVALLHHVTSALTMRYKFDLNSLRAGVATAYELSPTVNVATGVDVATSDAKDLKFGVSLKFN